jgi:ribosomal protein S18 acetylase RimI-like enzyme
MLELEQHSQAKVWELSLRAASLADAADLRGNCFPEQTLGEVQEYLRWCMNQQAKGRLVRLVAEVDGQAVANGQLSILPKTGEIGSLIVAPAYRRRGIGTRLIRALMDEAHRRQLQTVEITVRLDAPWVQAWYQRLGFVYAGKHDFGAERVAVLRLAHSRHQGGATPCPTA